MSNRERYLKPGDIVTVERPAANPTAIPEQQRGILIAIDTSGFAVNFSHSRTVAIEVFRWQDGGKTWSALTLKERRR